MMNSWLQPIDEDSPTPLWFQITEQLRAAIETGVFKPGDTLPSEAELNNYFRVSRATSRAALNQLQTAGLIVRRSGKGSIVVRKRVDQPVEELAGFSEDMHRRGLTPSYRVLEVGHAPASAEAAEALEVPYGTEIFRSHRLLLADNEPIGTAVSWLPPRLFRASPYPTSQELESGSLYRWLSEKCGITIRRAREYIEAAGTEATLAKNLGVTKGFPILIARRQSFDEHDKPVEYVTLSFRSDLYRFHLEVRR